MKKLLGLLVIFFIAVANTMNLIGCGNVASKKPDISPIKPKEPLIKDIFYYEKSKKEIISEIKEYDEIIKEIENSKNDYENKTDYQTELKQIQAEQFLKQAELNACEYQILLCQKENQFTVEQKSQAIQLLEKQIKNLNNALNLLEIIIDSVFDTKELQSIKNDIKKIEFILNELK